MKRNLVLLSLCILLGTGVAAAQTVVFNVGTANTDVANTGRAEVLGQVTLSGNITCGTNLDGLCASTQGTIQVTYQGVQADNAIATANIGLINTNGIEVCESIGSPPVVTCNAIGTYITTPFTVTNTPAGGVVSFGVKGGIDFAAGDQVVIRGVRGRIDQSSANTVGTQIFASLNTSPSTIASFSPISQVVATSKDPLTVSFSAATILQCIPGGTAKVTLQEGFNTAFVDERMPAPPANPRPLFVGADARLVSNSQVKIVVTNLPSGVTIGWPAASAVDSGTGLTGASLVFISQSASGDTAVYEFRTPDQGVSDINAEIFVITLVNPTNFTLTGTNADFGTAQGQAQMWPGANAANTGPEVRYNHPLENVPADNILTVGPCTTNLLFPWMAFLPGSGYDTGFAIANTSTDPYKTLPQAGTCTLNFYPSDSTKPLDTNPTALAGIAVTTVTIPSGATYAANISSPSLAAVNSANFLGYMIAVCRFQYGHGFAFITNTIGTPSALAQGYVALLIPDPLVLPKKTRSTAVSGDDQFFGVAPYGEGLTQ